MVRRIRKVTPKSTTRISPATFVIHCRSASRHDPVEYGHLAFKNAAQLESARLAPEVIFDYRELQAIGDDVCEVHYHGWVLLGPRLGRQYHLRRAIHRPDGVIEVKGGIR
jgi:hypothetical protein